MTASTIADPAKFRELRARVQDAMTERRHADAERWSEALAGGREIPRGLNAQSADGLSFWTRIHRQDRAYDNAGQPATMPGPILSAAGTSAE
jgi:hypothetical protein